MAVAWAAPISLVAGLLAAPFWGRGAFWLAGLIWALFLAGLAAFAALHGELGAAFLLRWAVASLAVLLILTIDLAGSTPLYKSGLHEDRRLQIALDEERCKGAGFCQRVCPTRVLEMDTQRRMATLPRADDCVQCGARIVQCPFDALSFRSKSGGIVPPETVRRFKLDLIGRRIRPAGPA